MTEMLVTEALNELKTLDSRIDRAIKTAKFIADAKTADNKVTPSKTKEDFKTEAQSSYDTIDNLIKRRDNIKAAIVASNAANHDSSKGYRYQGFPGIQEDITACHEESERPCC